MLRNINGEFTKAQQRARIKESLTRTLEQTDASLEPEDPIVKQASKYGPFASAVIMLQRPPSQITDRVSRADIDDITAYDIREALRDLRFTPEQTAVAASGMRFRTDFGFSRSIYSN